ncbi:DUF222 domain-containing protein [uncultured Amnibacterium sp.]|uniref:HNH endonuclease signature motif containing protein n=1 Tax=uncultured Amnibacterium sp. TaxID=1631851 RepID=UPI0035CC92A3
MDEAADLTAAVAAVAAVRDRFFAATGEELLADLDAIERLGRMVDGLRVRAAAEVEHRSRPILGTTSLAFTHGAKDGVQLVQQVARVHHREAARRIGLGTALAHRRGLLGETLPGRLPALTDAVTAGTVGLDAARVVVETVKEVRFRADADGVTAMVESLVHAAQVADLDTVKEIAADWRLALDPDGVAPAQRQRQRSRSLKIGDTLADGTTRVSMVMLPEHLAVLREYLQSRRRSTPLVRTEPGSEQPGEPLEPEWRETPDPDTGDARSRAQQDYDTAVGGFGLAARAEAAGFGGTTTTHQVVITVTADELLRREGQGWAAGIMAGLPMPTVEQVTCDGETRLQVHGPNGEPLFLSRGHRVFSPAQKLALVVAAGGRCEYPGCRVPHPYLEAHHVEWFQRDGGRTHIDNGIMLCSYHHHLIHAPDCPVEIRRSDGDLFVVPKAWTAPPGPEHRRRQHPDIARGRIRRASAPWWSAERRPDLLRPPREPAD